MTTRYERVYEQLAAIVGSKYVSNRDAELFLYHWDFITTTTGEGRCDFVVMPQTVEEIQQILLLANRERIPVVPTVSMINVGGEAIPRQGGIVIDLRRMNKVLEVNEDDMYAVVEGGITWAEFKGHLDKNHPELRAPVTFSPAGTGVVPSFLEWGMYDTSFRTGVGGHLLNGVEAVLPTGEVVRTGSAMVTPYWWDRNPLPDLTGLFIGWGGTMGIVTKASIKLWPKLGRSDWACFADTYKTGLPIVRRLSRADLGILWFLTFNHSMLMKTRGYTGLDLSKVPMEPEKAGIPDFYGMITLSAYTEKEMEAKAEALQSIVKEGGGQAVLMEDLFGTFPPNERGPIITALNQPSQHWWCWYFYRGGAQDWVGTICSYRALLDFYLKGREIAMRYGKHLCFVHRSMFGGHFHMARPFIESKKDDPEDIKKSTDWAKEMTKLGLQLGAIRYKACSWAAAMTMERAHPGSVELIRRLKKLLDPNGIMNPGQKPW